MGALDISRIWSPAGRLEGLGIEKGIIYSKTSLADAIPYGVQISGAQLVGHKTEVQVSNVIYWGISMMGRTPLSDKATL